MATLDRIETPTRSPLRWSNLLKVLQHAISALATLILFFITLEFLNAAEPLTGIGKGMLAWFDSALHWIAERLVAPFIPSENSAKPLFLLMMASLLMTLSGVARDRRVNMIALVLMLASILLAELMPDAAPESGPPPGQAIYWTIIAIAALGTGLISFSFFRKGVRKKRIAPRGKRERQFFNAFWVIMVLICAVHFFIQLGNPYADSGKIASELVSIIMLALLIRLGLYLIPSGLIFLQTLLWHSAFQPADEFQPNIWALLRDPFPANELIFPPGSVRVMLILVWLACSVAVVFGALSPTKLARRYAIAIGAALLVTLISVDLPGFGGAMLDMIRFVPSPA